MFAYTPLFPETDNLTEEFLKGRTYWINVSFAEMPEYKRIFETREKIQVPIINLSSSPVIRQVTERLKQQK